MPVFDNPNLIVGRETGDDAGVYAIAPDQAIVFTVDCFMPIHDDPFIFGQIAAANSLSDCWAMGGRPLMAVNVCGYPQRSLPLELLAEILRGGATKALEAGVPVAGGHTMSNPEPFYGMAVTGLIHPERIIANAGARPGDRILLTKPLGTGIVTTAMMKDIATAADLEAATASMTRLNKTASEVMVRLGAHAATDVTGFGILGHARRMAQESGVCLRLAWDSLPILPGALEYAAQGINTGGGVANRDFYETWADWGPGSEAQIRLACDPQTSGGLLISMAPDKAEEAVDQMRRGDQEAWVIGEVTAGPKGSVQFS